MAPKLKPEERLQLIKRIILGKEPVSKVCQEAGISRTLFYRWLKKYKSCPGSPEILTPGRKKPQISPKKVTPEEEKQILEIVRKNPSWSTKKISAALPKDSLGKPIVGNHGVQNVLERLNLSTKEARVAYVKKISRPKEEVLTGVKLTPEQKLEMLERVVVGKENISKVCQEYGISRTLFYRLKRRYQEAALEEKLRAVAPQVRHIERYWRQTPERYEQAVLNLVIKHPEYSVRRIVEHLPQVAGVPIVGHHGVQNILRRHNLSLYEQRLAYASAQVTPVTRLIGAWEQAFARFFAFPPQTRQAIIRFVGVSGLSALTTVIVLGTLGYFVTVFGQAAPVYRPGLIFASIALLVGMIFFAYSMKYYFTLALVLSFSSQTGPTSPEASRGERNGNGWLARIFGVNGSLRGPTSEEVGPQQVLAGGLQPNLDHIKLSRYPFISVHLPFYNEKKVAERILSACTSFDYPNYEVIVCDDSTDETVQIVKEWETRLARRAGESRREHPQVKVLHRPTREGFKGGALREALKHMDPRTEFVIVFDADFIPYPDTLEMFVKYFKATGGWEERLSYQASKLSSMPYDTFSQLPITNYQLLESQEKEILKKNNIACIAGYQWHVLNKSENWITRGVRTEYAGSYVIERPGQEILGALKIIHGSVYCIRADVLKHFGWGTSITEDFELTLRIYEKGFKVIYTPYVQAPSECVSTIKRLIRQRMRWAEGHSFNVRKMFLRLLFGKWETVKTEDRGRTTDTEDREQKTEHQPSVIGFQNPSSAFSLPSSRRWVPSPLTLTEKLEFLYLSPYYLQALFFLVGTFSWLMAETVFRARLPFWTSLWGWSLVLTNFFALPLVNAVGLFLEESEERDYLGILSFVALSYLLVPFQAYASVKGFLEKEEGPWFRTPKTGLITDIFTRGRFYRWISGILPGRVGRPAVSPSLSSLAVSALVHPNDIRMEILRMNPNPSTSSGQVIRTINSDNLNLDKFGYLALATANNRFANFTIRPKRLRWVSKVVLTILLCASISLFPLANSVPVVLATPAPFTTWYLYNDDSTAVSGTASWKLVENTVDSASDSTTKVAASKVTTYDFSVCGTDCDTSTDWWASQDDVDQFPFGGSTANRNDHVENTDAQYDAISSSNDTRHQTDDPSIGDEIFYWMEMKINEAASSIAQLDFTFEGYLNGEAANFSIWVKKTGQAYELDASWVQVGTSQNIPTGADTSFTRSLTTGFSDYIGADGMLTWGVYEDADTQYELVDYVKVDVTAKATANQAYYYPPGTTNTNTPTNASTCSGLGYTSGNGRGWIWDTPFQEGGYISSGNWTFYIYESDNDANGVGGAIICVWKVTLTSNQINASGTLLVQIADTTPTTDLWDGGVSNVSYTASGESQKDFSTGDYIYVEYWNYITTAPGVGATTTFYTGDITGEDPRIVTPNVQIPENVAFFLAAAPFIPLVVLWLRRRRGLTAQSNGPATFDVALIGNADLR
ncbi:MAG: glycosyltransferase [Patescibacteria group bacterium]